MSVKCGREVRWAPLESQLSHLPDFFLSWLYLQERAFCRRILFPCLYLALFSFHALEMRNKVCTCHLNMLS